MSESQKIKTVEEVIWFYNENLRIGRSVFSFKDLKTYVFCLLIILEAILVVVDLCSEINSYFFYSLHLVWAVGLYYCLSKIVEQTKITYEPKYEFKYEKGEKLFGKQFEIARTIYFVKYLREQNYNARDIEIILNQIDKENEFFTLSPFSVTLLVSSLAAMLSSIFNFLLTKHITNLSDGLKVGGYFLSFWLFLWSILISSTGNSSMIDFIFPFTNFSRNKDLKRLLNNAKLNL